MNFTKILPLLIQAHYFIVFNTKEVSCKVQKLLSDQKKIVDKLIKNEGEKLVRISPTKVGNLVDKFFLESKLNLMIEDVIFERCMNMNSMFDTTFKERPEELNTIFDDYEYILTSNVSKILEESEMNIKSNIKDTFRITNNTIKEEINAVTNKEVESLISTLNKTKENVINTINTDLGDTRTTTKNIVTPLNQSLIQIRGRIAQDKQKDVLSHITEMLTDRKKNTAIIYDIIFPNEEIIDSSIKEYTLEAKDYTADFIETLKTEVMNVLESNVTSTMENVRNMLLDANATVLAIIDNAVQNSLDEVVKYIDEQTTFTNDYIRQSISQVTEKSLQVTVDNVNDDLDKFQVNINNHKNDLTDEIIIIVTDTYQNLLLAIENHLKGENK